MSELITAGMAIKNYSLDKPNCLSLTGLTTAIKHFGNWFEVLREDRKRSSDTLKRVYSKHVLDNDNIGWDELSDELCNNLCELIGDEEFVKWVNSQ